MERVRNPGTPGFYFRLFLVPKKNGKLRTVIDISLLNQYINKQHFKMETVKSVRQSIMVNDWAVSIDLTDAYFHVPIHPRSRKYLRFVYEHQVFQFTALPFGMSLSLDFHKINECNSSTLTTTCVSLFPYLDNWLIRYLICNRHLAHKIYPSNGTKSGFYTKSKEVRFDTNTRIHLFRYGISNSPKYSQRTSGPSKSSYPDYQNNSLPDSNFDTNFLSLLGKLSAAADLILLSRLHLRLCNVPIIGLETSHSSLRLSGYDQQNDESPFEMVDEYQSLRSRYAQSPSRPKDIPLYGCQSFRLGSLSGTDESILLWLPVGRPNQLHINMLEIMAIRFSLIRAFKYIHTSCVMISTDHTTVVSYINKQGGTHSPNLCVEIWKIFQ